MARIVIVGAGFGGIEVARHLEDQDVTLISDRQKFVFWPSMPYVLSKYLPERRYSFDLKRFATKNDVKLVQGTVTSVNRAKRTVRCGNQNIPYDYLVLATGSRTNHYGKQDIKRHSHDMKEPMHVAKLRDMLQKMKKGSVVIAGGGITGIETALEVRALTAQNIKVTIVEGNHRILAGTHEKAARKVERHLISHGISVFTNAAVHQRTKNTIKLSNGRSLPCDVLVWCAGITPNIVDINVARTPRGHIITNPYLQSVDDERIYALGDCASHLHEGSPVLWTAHEAMEQGKLVAENVRRATIQFEYEPYLPSSTPLVITLGPRNALMLFAHRSILSPLIRPLKDLIEIFYMTTRR